MNKFTKAFHDLAKRKADTTAAQDEIAKFAELVKEMDRQAAQAYVLLAAMDDAPDLRKTFGHFQVTLSALRARALKLNTRDLDD